MTSTDELQNQLKRVPPNSKLPAVSSKHELQNQLKGTPPDSKLPAVSSKDELQNQLKGAPQSPSKLKAPRCQSAVSSTDNIHNHLPIPQLKKYETAR